MRQKDRKHGQEPKGGNENNDSDGVNLGKFGFGSVGKWLGHQYCFVKKIPASQQDWVVASGGLPR